MSLRKRLFQRIQNFFTKSPIIGITPETIDLICETGKASHPNEFAGILHSSPHPNKDGRVITDMYLTPNAKSSQTQVTYNPYNLPNSPSFSGSVHSHPNGVLQPSDADIDTFQWGTIHIIVGAPYTPSSWEAYHSDGTPREIPVIRDMPD